MTSKSILYVGCPTPEREEAARLLAAAALEVVWADTTSGALNKLQRRDMPVLLDLSRGFSALRTARELRTRRARTLLFGVADMSRPEFTVEAVVSGFADVFPRPLGPSRVVNAIKRESPSNGGRRRSQQPETLEDLYSLSPSMREVSERIAQMGGAGTISRAGVIVRGERGTGRQVMARAIHEHRSKTARFIAIDCTAFVAEELERELFGAVVSPDRSSAHPQSSGLEHVSRVSALYDALGGTCYLRNLIAAPERVQLRLARALCQRNAVLVETGEPIAMDVRPMAGVDPDVDQAVREGRLRPDLYRRLSAIRIDMPPLRQRREDIPALANCFLRRVCASRKVSPKTFSRPALSLMAALPWRGNAPELRQVIETLAEASAGESISLDDVLASVRIDGGSVAFATRGTLKQAHTHFDREYIATVLERHRGNVSAAARALGIQRTNLYRKLRRLRSSGDTVASIRPYHSRHIE